VSKEKTHNLILDPLYRWRSVRRGDLCIHFFGDEAPAIEIADALAEGEDVDADAAGAAARGRIGHFAAIFESPNFVLGVVDACRTIPLFYASGENRFVAGNSAHEVRKAARLDTVDKTSALEGIMAGFVTGPYTLYEGLKQLQAGELFFWNKSEKSLTRNWYYKYESKPMAEFDVDQLTDGLETVVNRIMRRIVDHADGDPILVPLSGGLDSRLILSKLVELGYDNLKSFSYGPPGNSEARAAKFVADTLGVPWEFVPTTHAATRRFYETEVRREYSVFGDGLCSIPNMQDLQPLLTLREEGRLPEDTMLVNGQSGDFITGAHIPASLMISEPSVEDVISAVTEKHYSLWRSLMTRENLARVEVRIREVAGMEDEKERKLERDQATALYEMWEHHERQSKFVVHGQRVYDFLGHCWHLPLWDFDLMAFFEKIPTEWKFQRALYRRLLERWNFKGLFADFHPNIWGWNWPAIALILPLSWIGKAVLGARRRDGLICYGHYFGRIGNHYAPAGFGKFLKHARDMRNPNSLYAALWLDERGVMKFSL
jgi:asparagine synthase (glutamine-hydrolysing)